MSFAALPAPVVRLLANLGLGELLAAAGVLALLFLAVAPWMTRRVAGPPAPQRQGVTVRLSALAVAAGLVFVGALATGQTLRALARDVSEDRHEVADRLPVGSTVGQNGPAGRAVVWAVGDGPDGQDPSQAVGRLVTADDPDRVFFLGDVYGPYSADMKQTFAAFTARVAATPGNHDWPRSATEYLRFWDRAGSNASQYYSFRLGGWQVLSLNSEVPHGAGSAQAAWLQREVSGPGNCRIAFFHRPRFSAGRHGDQPDIEPIWTLLVGRAALVLNGHDHDMQRLNPVQGTTEMVVGAGGHGHYALHPYPGLAFGDDRHYGALRLRLSSGAADYQFISTGGRVLDQGSIACSTG